MISGDGIKFLRNLLKLVPISDLRSIASIFGSFLLVTTLSVEINVETLLSFISSSDFISSYFYFYILSISYISSSSVSSSSNTTSSFLGIPTYSHITMSGFTSKFLYPNFLTYFCCFLDFIFLFIFLSFNAIFFLIISSITIEGPNKVAFVTG